MIMLRSFIKVHLGLLGVVETLGAYMLEYSSDPLYELGYINRHIKDTDKLKAIEGFFQKGANAGVRVLIKPHLMNDANLDFFPANQHSPYTRQALFWQ